jgi:hypothetical protein
LTEDNAATDAGEAIGERFRNAEDAESMDTAWAFADHVDDHAVACSSPPGPDGDL